MVKDFVRAILFPLIQDLVPSSTRQGAEAFLTLIRKNKEIFEYGTADTENLSSIWSKYAEGEISMAEAVTRSSAIAAGSVQVIDHAAAQRASDVLGDVVENERVLEQSAPELAGTLEPMPAIVRLNSTSSAKLLYMDPNDPALRGYRCFLALTDRAQQEFRDFFLQPHSTSIVWGGQKAVFIFQHHSNTFGFYYDLLANGLVGRETGSVRSPTCTIVLKDKVFLPIPAEIQPSFMPGTDERKRFEVRFDLLYTTNSD